MLGSPVNDEAKTVNVADEKLRAMVLEEEVAIIYEMVDSR
jgi:hypothetical protein